LSLLSYKSHMVQKVKTLVCEMEEGKGCDLNFGGYQVLLDMGGLVCLLCDIKYQYVCECYLKVLYATVFFLAVENHSLHVW